MTPATQQTDSGCLEGSTLVEVNEWKQIECDNCGRVSNVIRWIPIKLACCGQCGSTKIRRYWGDKKRRSRT